MNIGAPQPPRAMTNAAQAFSVRLMSSPALTRADLEECALARLQRASTSTQDLRRRLEREVARAVERGRVDPDQGASWIEAILDRYQETRLLDDRRFAESRAASRHHQGQSLAQIRGELESAGVRAPDRTRAIAELGGADAEIDLRAAITFARKRRLGPFREAGERAERRERDLAALLRRGFSESVAERVADAASVESLEESLS